MIMCYVFTLCYDMNLSECINTNVINSTHELDTISDMSIITKLFLKR